MGTLRWFAGGQERRGRAIFLINQMFSEFDSKNANPLYQVLDSYRT